MLKTRSIASAILLFWCWVKINALGKQIVASDPFTAFVTFVITLVAMFAIVVAPFVAIIFIAVFVLFVIAILAYLGMQLVKSGSRARQDLDSVESGVVLGINPLRLLGMIVMSLVRKGDLRIRSANPLKVEVIEERDETLCTACGGPLHEGDAKCDYCGKVVAKSAEHTYYETAFLENAISSDGTLDEGGANGVIRMLEASVESKMQGYSPEATRAYYQQMLKGLWNELESTPDDAKGYDFSKNSAWLALDDEFEDKSAQYSKDRRISRLRDALKETTDNSGIEQGRLG